MIIDKLQEFRQQAYNFLGNGRDAIFDLMDAVDFIGNKQKKLLK